MAAQRKCQTRPDERSQRKKAPPAAFRDKREDRHRRCKNGDDGGPAEASAHSSLPSRRIREAPKGSGECVKALEADRQQRSEEPDAENDVNGHGSGALDPSKP